MSGLTRTKVAAILSLAAIGVVATASSTPRPAQAADKPAAGQCFNIRFINGFNAPNDNTLYIRIGANEIYRLDLMHACLGMSFRHDIALETVPPGDSFICSAIQAEVTYNEAGIRERCPVDAMHKLTPDEIAALPKQKLP